VTSFALHKDPEPWRHPDEAGPLVRALLLEAATHEAPARAALRTSAKKLLRALPCAVLVVAPDGSIALANDAAAALLGAPRRSLEGRALDAVLAPVDVLRGAVAAGARGEVRVPLPSGAQAALGFTWAPCPVAAGHVLVVLDDARARKAQTAPEPSPFDVPEVLQMAALAKKSLVVDVETDAGHVGRIVVKHGEPWCAQDDEGSGRPAFARLVFRPGARPVCRALEPGLFVQDLTGSLDNLLLDAARALDEAAR
jgi:PAS domain-containing protein